MIYTVTFNPSVDCILHIGDVKFGGLNRASKEEFFFSGKGINVSTVLHRLGAATSAITFVGGFTGSETERVLSPDVPLDVIRLAEGCTRINVKLKAPDGSETEINAPGAPDRRGWDAEAVRSAFGARERGYARAFGQRSFRCRNERVFGDIRVA